MANSKIKIPPLFDLRLHGGAGGAQFFTPSGPGLLREWTGQFGANQGFTASTGIENGVRTYAETPNQHAFRHAFVAGAKYLKAYIEDPSGARKDGISESVYQKWTADKVLWWGFFNEYRTQNALHATLSHYQNNYEGILIARESLIVYGKNVTDDQLDLFVAQKVIESANLPSGEGRLVIYNTTDPRTSGDKIVQRFDKNRLPPSEYTGNVPYLTDLVPSLVKSKFGSYENQAKCFPAGTPILIPGNAYRPIESLNVGDWIMAFDPAQPFAGLVPQQIGKLKRNTTLEWLKLVFLDGGTLSATSGHEMLAADGTFARLDQLVQWQADGIHGRVVLVGEGGALRAGRVERIRLSSATAPLYALASLEALAAGHPGFAYEGNLALKHGSTGFDGAAAWRDGYRGASYPGRGRSHTAFFHHVPALSDRRAHTTQRSHSARRIYRPWSGHNTLSDGQGSARRRGVCLCRCARLPCRGWFAFRTPRCDRRRRALTVPVEDRGFRAQPAALLLRRRRQGASLWSGTAGAHCMHRRDRDGHLRQATNFGCRASRPRACRSVRKAGAPFPGFVQAPEGCV